MSSQLDTLTRINLDDLVSSFGWQDQPLLAATLRGLFRRPARRFARQIVEYDNLVGLIGIHEASSRLLQQRYIHDLRVHGREHVPARGPALFLSNHPGMADTVSLFTAIDRSDLRIIAFHRPFLAALCNISNHLSYISEDSTERMRAVRQVSTHLRAGGAALTFPAGRIEPDPAVHPDSLESLKDWTNSSAVFLRMSRETKIVPVLVSGVIWEKAVQSWLANLKRSREDRDKLATALQLLAMVTRDARPTTVHVQFGKPITLEEVGSLDADCIHEKLMERMKCLTENRNQDQGVSVL